MNKFAEVSPEKPIIIDKLVPGGQGLATLPNGKKAFFWNVLPGESVVSYQITKQKTKYIEAVATKIETPSPYRVPAKDACYLSTSPWQIIDYPYELKLKRELLQESFVQAGLGDILASFSRSHAQDEPSEEAIPNVVTDNHDYFYRNKMEYSLYYSHEDARIHLAFHRRGSHAKIPIEQSSIERPEILKKAQEIVAELNSHGEEARKYQSLLMRCDQSGNVSGGLFENGKSHPVFNNLTDRILDHEYSYSPNGFFQINIPVYEMALMEIQKHIKTENVLDLYAGVGTIGLSVARGQKLTLVEVNAAAYRELANNCRPSQTGHSSSFGDIKAVLSKSEEALSFVEANQTVIVDPPRAGIDHKLTEHLLTVLPESIIYLSCNPSTQARDIKLLTQDSKYQIVKIQPFNFFPHTPHLENLVVLQRV